MEYEITGGYDDNITIHHHAAKGYIFIFIDNPGNDIRSAGTSIIAENNADTKSQQAGTYYTSMNSCPGPNNCGSVPSGFFNNA